jgi:hypothetical protein
MGNMDNLNLTPIPFYPPLALPIAGRFMRQPRQLRHPRHRSLKTAPSAPIAPSAPSPRHHRANPVFPHAPSAPSPRHHRANPLTFYFTLVTRHSYTYTAGNALQSTTYSIIHWI